MSKENKECDKCYTLTQEIIALQETMMKMQDKHIAFLKGTLDKIDTIKVLREEETKELKKKDMPN